MTGDPFENYRQLLEKIDRFAANLRAQHPHSFACRPGCSSCCVAGITVWRIEHDHIASFSSAREHESTRGREYACPLLQDDGTCTVYPERPVVCRLWGLPILIPAGSEAEWGLRGHATAAVDSGGSVICCDLNFTGTPALADLPQTAPISARTVITTLAAVNHVYCKEKGLDPEERLPLSSLKTP